ncbi:MAG: DUF695 domain-containing protein [Spirochaetes bacterium]|nr:DUF695 domain-containing protein [Spirochaetota bacterium]
MYQNIAFEYDNFNYHLSNKPLKISYNFKFKNDEKLKYYSYIYCIKIEIKDIITKTFYSYFINEFMRIMLFKNKIHEKIIKNKGLYLSHIINNGIIKFIYLINKNSLKEVRLKNYTRYNCFKIDFRLYKNIDNTLENFFKNF